MRLRELLVAIKIKANTKGAEQVDKLLAQITKHARTAGDAINRTTKAAGKLDKNLLGAAKSGKRASKGLDDFARSAKKAEHAAEQAGKAADKAGDKMAKAGSKGGRGGGLAGAASKIPKTPGAQTALMGGAIATGAAVVAGAGFAANIAMERESLRATLKNLEGDEQKAKETFGRIELFASTTPFAIEEVTGALIKLKAQGLNSTDDALRSYGDLASTFGKSMDDIVEAAKDATTGENERLKEFGITARTVGDNVNFTFKGQTVTVAKNSAEIEKYLISLGKLPGVAGAMQGQMDTLNGRWSNFKDSVFSAVDASMTASGALDELKGLLGDVTNTATDGADVFGGFLAESIKDLRTWVKSLTREQIKEWMERAAETGKDLLEMLLGVTSAAAVLVTGIAELVEGMEGAGPVIETMALALGALMLAGGGLPGLFAAIAVAAIKMGMESDGFFTKLFEDTEKARRMGLLGKTMIELQGQVGGESVADASDMVTAGEDSSIKTEDVVKIQEANRAGFGEELFQSASDQLASLGIEDKVDPGDLAGRTARLQKRGGQSPEVILGQRGDATKFGVNKEAGRLLDAIEEKKSKDLDSVRKRAKKRGLDAEATDTLVAARQAELDARSKKAAASFTGSLRKDTDFDEALKAGLAELDDKEKKKKKGKKKKKDKEVDILEALGLKGAGSILENRPAPQSLMIQTTILVKAAEQIDVSIKMPAGATLGETGDAAGKEVGRAIDANIRDKLLVIVDDAWSLRWDALAKMRGGGRVPKSSKRRGNA